MNKIFKAGWLNSFELAIWATFILRLLKIWLLKNDDGNFLILVIVPVLLLTIIIHGFKGIYFKYHR
ncbi:hypothetical protein G7084_07945 [Weissella coleopterorum]|uniref:Uncharacterized protein n=1 Tax=Weissella coleopterorum TaxID=2714949 RepID=A0A6G8B1W9_9LACO|nr:hypothetical protein [Weissella coleopterorum]QIL51222.1 hypothetical protein G7084_07945 [Weissella coleopterorum]